ncbi:hypothetical protein [Natronococcus sp. A-GB7]|uniref:hypothetical protein n=1 Tax=Natronococcus sp. A-GB7 TaxID=3037649 RepID=UPI00241DF7DE|nr:hypothetical protein [Natronococcus sp. A-GB7]MDG5819774.1 hypothetical protein [Natronococcus sp. A-GB7]
MELSGSNSYENELTNENSAPGESYEELQEERKRRFEERVDFDFGALATVGENDDNLEYVDHWEHDYDVNSDQTGATIAETDHVITLLELIDDYGNRVTDYEGRYVYVFEHYSKSEGQHRWWHGDPKTTHLDNHLDISNSNVELTDRDPSTTRTIDGDYATVSLEGSARSVGFSLSYPVYVDNGQIGPGKYSPGSAGEYSVRFSGCSERDVTDTIGYSELRSSVVIPDLESGIGLSWSTEAKAQTTNSGPC